MRTTPSHMNLGLTMNIINKTHYYVFIFSEKICIFGTLEVFYIYLEPNDTKKGTSHSLK